MDLILEPYYTSVRATLVLPDGWPVQLGELPKFVTRYLGWDWRDFVKQSVGDTEKAASLVVDGMRERMGLETDEQVFEVLKNSEPWAWWF